MQTIHLGIIRVNNNYRTYLFVRLELWTQNDPVDRNAAGKLCIYFILMYSNFVKLILLKFDGFGGKFKIFHDDSKLKSYKTT